ncbi:VOC family protein [Aliiroseovarius crassostreae]|uniref:VOC family protein n=1 Tax=Aliiroseovarius crassostreae TaxID=154981 RepID=UPI00220887B3|nr:VOC family protein [Aliiroseovarius crassostreae]UWQ08140.1 VOC family protein [Aliiroseovarius crassostreae]UWQ11240.1 VOC family protein [Aliiroseovarius crassostreae]
MPTVSTLDHLVLTVTNLQDTIRFYEDVMGMRAVSFHPADGSTRWALCFGSQKINLHPAKMPFDPKAAAPAPGSADLCFLSDRDLAEWQAHLEQMAIPVEEGPVRRSGATGPILSLYLRDPDGNLIEVANTLG